MYQHAKIAFSSLRVGDGQLDRPNSQTFMECYPAYATTILDMSLTDEQYGLCDKLGRLYVSI